MSGLTPAPPRSVGGGATSADWTLVPDCIGPKHHGLRMCEQDFERLPWERGYRIELVDGVLQVTPLPDPYHFDIAANVCELLKRAKGASGRAIFEHVRLQARVHLPGAGKSGTCIEPDVAAYLNFPPPPTRSYRGIQPALVVEVVSPGYAKKDYVRNVTQYSLVAEILEYWIFDPTKDITLPSMTVFHRNPGESEFQRFGVAEGEVFVCRRWPELRVDLSEISVTRY